MQYKPQVDNAITEMLNIFKDPDVVKVQDYGRKRGYITKAQSIFIGQQHRLLFPTVKWNSWWYPETA